MAEAILNFLSKNKGLHQDASDKVLSLVHELCDSSSMAANAWTGLRLRCCRKERDSGHRQDRSTLSYNRGSVVENVYVSLICLSADTGVCLPPVNVLYQCFGDFWPCPEYQESFDDNKVLNVIHHLDVELNAFSDYIDSLRQRRFDGDLEEAENVCLKIGRQLSTLISRFETSSFDEKDWRNSCGLCLHLFLAHVRLLMDAEFTKTEPLSDEKRKRAHSFAFYSALPPPVEASDEQMKTLIAYMLVELSWLNGTIPIYYDKMDEDWQHTMDYVLSCLGLISKLLRYFQAVLESAQCSGCEFCTLSYVASLLAYLSLVVRKGLAVVIVSGTPEVVDMKVSSICAEWLREIVKLHWEMGVSLSHRLIHWFSCSWRSAGFQDFSCKDDFQSENDTVEDHVPSENTTDVCESRAEVPSCQRRGAEHNVLPVVASVQNVVAQPSLPVKNEEEGMKTEILNKYRSVFPLKILNEGEDFNCLHSAVVAVVQEEREKRKAVSDSETFIKLKQGFVDLMNNSMEDGDESKIDDLVKRIVYGQYPSEDIRKCLYSFMAQRIIYSGWTFTGSEERIAVVGNVVLAIAEGDAQMFRILLHEIYATFPHFVPQFSESQSMTKKGTEAAMTLVSLFKALLTGAGRGRKAKPYDGNVIVQPWFRMELFRRFFRNLITLQDVTNKFWVDFTTEVMRKCVPTMKRLFPIDFEQCELKISNSLIPMLEKAGRKSDAWKFKQALQY